MTGVNASSDIPKCDDSHVQCHYHGYHVCILSIIDLSEDRNLQETLSDKLFVPQLLLHVYALHLYE